MSMKALQIIGTFFIGLVLALGGIDKIIHWEEFQFALSKYPFLPDQNRTVWASMVVALELLLAAFLVRRTWRKYVLGACSVVFMVFALVVYILYRLQEGAACGCFFSFGSTKANLLHVVQNVALAVLSLFLSRSSCTTTSDGETIQRGYQHPIPNNQSTDQ